MKSSTIGVFASLVAIVASIPFEKRVEVVDTVVESIVTTIEETTTVWVPAGAPTDTPAKHEDNKQAGGYKNAAAAVVPSTTTTQAAAAPPAASTPTTTSTPSVSAVAAYIAPSTTTSATTTWWTPSTTLTPTSRPAQVQAQVQAPAAPVAPVAPAAPAAPAPSSSAAAPASSSASASSSSGSSTSESSAACGQTGGKCVGDMTFYDTTDALPPAVFKVSGAGSCGWYNNGTVEDVFALAHGMMGEVSNGNSFCGRTATFKLNGKIAVGKLTDKCGGCLGASVDLSFHLWDQLGVRDVGRYSGVEWYFND